MRKSKKAIKTKKGIINNSECYTITMTIGELIQAMGQKPNQLFEKITSDAGPNFDLSIIQLDDMPPELRATLVKAGLLEDDEKL